jgi:hypothetical protein
MDDNILLNEELIDGELCSYPVDAFARVTYGITVDEMRPFMTKEYFGIHTSVILKLILENRKKTQ